MGDAGSRMKRAGPDSLNSWIIAAACCFINMMMYGMSRLSGVLFVASVPRFNVGRADASFPYTFSNFMRNTSGPLVGFLGHKFGVRPVTMFGCFLGAFGASMCYFAEDIPTVTILWGAVFGLGFGLGNILLPISINQHFDKHRATASGISFSGACLGSFALPPIVDYLINAYGLSGTFLFLAGFILNCVPAALLLKKPDFQIKKAKPQCQEEDNSGEKQSIMAGKKVKLYTVEDHSRKLPIKQKYDYMENTAENQALNREDIENPSLSYEERIKRLSTQTLLSNYSIRMSSSEPLDFEEIIQHSKGRRQIDPSVLDGETSSHTSQITDPDLNSEKDEVFIKVNDTTNQQGDGCQSTKSHAAGNSYQNSVELPTEYFLPPSKVNDQSKNYSEIYDNFAYQRDAEDNLKAYPALGKKEYKNSTSFTPTVSSDTYNKEHDNTNDTVRENGSTLGSFSVIFDPVFILIALSNSIYSFTFVCMITVIVDFARDLGVGEDNEKYVLMSLSVGDLIGRLCLGAVTDRGYMTKICFSAICFICQGFATAILAWSTGFAFLMGFIALYGLSEAGLILIFPLIIAEYIEEDKQTVAISCSHFLSGPLCLAVAPLIGFFRDDIGSYNYIFYGVGILSALCCIMLLLVPCVSRCRRRR